MYHSGLLLLLLDRRQTCTLMSDTKLCGHFPGLFNKTLVYRINTQYSSFMLFNSGCLFWQVSWCYTAFQLTQLPLPFYSFEKRNQKEKKSSIQTHSLIPHLYFEAVSVQKQNGKRPRHWKKLMSNNVVTSAWRQNHGVSIVTTITIEPQPRISWSEN